METVDLVPLIDQLDDNIDDLEVALEPLFKNALPNVAGKLPLLDKAHLFVLVTYAIESILFCMYLSVDIIMSTNRYQHIYVLMMSMLKSILSFEN